MSKQKIIRGEGVVTEVLRDARFIVKMNDDREVSCVLAGRMRKHYIRIILGDKVNVELTPYDISQGRIVYRFK